MAALFSWIPASLGRNAFNRGPFLFAAYYFPTCKKGNREKECELFREGQSAGFRLTSTSSRRRTKPELIEWRFHGHYARQEPAGALLHGAFHECSRLNRRGFVLVPCDCVFCQCLLAVEIYLYSCRRSFLTYCLD